MTKNEIKIQAFRKAILEFYKERGRKNLPWRNTKDPWKVILSEFLLRKTTAKQAENVYPVLEKYSPEDIQPLSEKNLQSILKPLGIHKERARLIKELADRISQMDGIPCDEKTLMSLPGVGRYVANAVLVISFGQDKPMLDRNFIRVIERFFGKISENKRPHTDNALWEYAESLIPKGKGKEFNWGVLDFANELCTARKPKHAECPLYKKCTFYNLENV